MSLANLIWCGGPVLGSFVVEMVLIWTPLILLGWCIQKAKDKQFREGKRQGVKPSNGFLDWMFHKD